MTTNTGKVGKLGTIVVPARLGRKFGLEEGALVIFEEREEGILIRPALAVPMEVYSLARKAEFLLSNAVDPEDYSDAVEEVKRMGLDPETILHDKPAEGNKESELGR